MNISFSAPWGRKVTIITILTSALLLLLPIIQVVALLASNVPAMNKGILVASALLSPLVLLGCAFFMVRGYTLDAGRLIVQRLIWSNTLDLGELESVHHDPEATKRSRKIIGNDGLFAMHGTFRNKTLGRYKAFITDPKRAVVLKLRTRTVVVTPDDPERFIKEIERTFPKLVKKGERSAG